MKSRTILLAMTLAFSGAASVALADSVPPPPPPPKLEPIPEPIANASDAAAEPEVTVSKRNGERIEEFRYKGRLYMIRVYPVVGLPYTLVDDKGDGVFNRRDARDAPGTTVKPAQWKVISW